MAESRRLTRAEQREVTRQRLLDAAETLFVRRGIAAASIEEIAEEAGFSRGAFYSNFADKNALVLALLSRKAEADSADLTALFERRTSAADFLASLRRRELDQARNALAIEFHLHAMRNPDARPRLAALMASSRVVAQGLINELWEDIDAPLPVEAELASRVLQALDDGIAMLRLVEPDAYPPGMYSDVVVVLHEALVALAERGNHSPASPG